jgi:hypothetical protein
MVFEGIEKVALEYEISNLRKPSPNRCELSGCVQETPINCSFFATELVLFVTGVGVVQLSPKQA